MKIEDGTRRDGFVFRMAYGMWGKKERSKGEIDTCFLPWRFLLSCVCWFFITLFFVGGSSLVWIPFLFFGLGDGERPVWPSGGRMSGFENLPGYAYIGRLLPVCYEWRKIESPTFQNIRKRVGSVLGGVVIIVVVVAFIAVFSILVGGMVSFFLEPDVARGPERAYWALKMGLLTLGLAAIAAVIFVVGRAMYSSLDHYESVRLLRAWLKARKEKICPIIKVVD